MTIEPITEDDFQSQVIQLAVLFGWKVYHTHDSRRSVAGFPDLVLLRRGEQIVAELKIGNKQPTREQLAWLQEFRLTGCKVFVWRPADWPQIEMVLA